VAFGTSNLGRAVGWIVRLSSRPWRTTISSAGERPAKAATRRELREECQALLAEIPIPTPFTLDGLIAGIEAVRSRRIKLVPIADHLLARGDAFSGCEPERGDRVLRS
jgi:hypothetical protein